jgi:hypothetical protein
MFKEWGNEELWNVLGPSHELARSRFRALLKRPEFLSLEQKAELEALVGREWMRLRIDIQRHMSWSALADKLLRSIDSTQSVARSDVHWTALLSQARQAVQEAHVAASHIQDSWRPDDRRPDSLTDRPGEAEIGAEQLARDALLKPQRRVDGPDQPGGTIRGV